MGKKETSYGENVRISVKRPVSLRQLEPALEYDRELPVWERICRKFRVRAITMEK